MTDNAEKSGSSAPTPNMRSEAERGMYTIFRMGILHAAFELRGNDFEGIPDEHADALAAYLEHVAENVLGPAEWPLPEDRGRPVPKHGSGP